MTTLGAIAMSVMRLGPRAPGRTMARVGASTAKATAMSHRYPSEGLGRKMRRDVVSFAVIAPASLTDYARERSPPRRLSEPQPEDAKRRKTPHVEFLPHRAKQEYECPPHRHGEADEADHHGDAGMKPDPQHQQARTRPLVQYESERDRELEGERPPREQGDAERARDDRLHEPAHPPRRAEGGVGRPVIERGAIGPHRRGELREGRIEVDACHLKPRDEQRRPRDERRDRPRGLWRALPVPGAGVGHGHGYQEQREDLDYLISSIRDRGRHREAVGDPPVRNAGQPWAPARRNDEQDRRRDRLTEREILARDEAEEAEPTCSDAGGDARKAQRRPEERLGRARDQRGRGGEREHRPGHAVHVRPRARHCECLRPYAQPTQHRISSLTTVLGMVASLSTPPHPHGTGSCRTSPTP